MLNYCLYCYFPVYVAEIPDLLLSQACLIYQIYQVNSWILAVGYPTGNMFPGRVACSFFLYRRLR